MNFQQATFDVSKYVETKMLLQIALPLVATYAAEYAMFVSSKIVVGNSGFESLAVVGLAGDLSVNLLAILMGLFSIVGVLVAQAAGAGRKDAASESARQGLLVSMVFGLIFTFFVWNLDYLMEVTGQPSIIVENSTPYLHALALFFLPAVLFSVLRTIIAAIGRTEIIMVITISAVGLNYVLADTLVNGKFGLPKLGYIGAGWALSIVHWLMLLTLLLYMHMSKKYSDYGFFDRKFKPNASIIKEILRLGIPVAGLTILEVGLFSAIAILSGLFGTVSLAAYQVIFGWIALAFVFAHGFAEATMVRVAHGVGRKSAMGSRQAGLLGMGIVTIMLMLMAFVPLFLSDLIVHVFLDDTDPGFNKVKKLVLDLIVIVVIFQIFDGLQIVASMALRGIKDTIIPLWIAGFGYWVLGLGSGCLAAFFFDVGVQGLWWGLSLGLIATGSALCLRFYRLSKSILEYQQETVLSDAY